MRKRHIFAMYCSGLLELALSCLGGATVALMMMQFLSYFAGIEIQASGALLFAWQSFMLMALWPGQAFWTIRRTTPCGYEHSIIGVPSDDDVRVQNRQVARRIRERVRD